MDNELLYANRPTCCCDIICSLTIVMLVCPQESGTDSKLMTISDAVSVRLQTDCSCSVAIRNPVFSCANTADSKAVVFLAELQAEVDVPSLLTSWVSSGPVITVNSIQLQVDTTCPVVIDSMQAQSCSVAPPTDVIAAAVGVSILVVVIIIVVIVTALVVLCRKRSRFRCVCSHHYQPIPLCIILYTVKF